MLNNIHFWDMVHPLHPMILELEFTINNVFNFSTSNCMYSVFFLANYSKLGANCVHSIDD